MNTFSKALMITLVTLGLSACHPDGGDMKAVDAGTTGSPDAGSTTGPAAFLGKWGYAAGTSRTTLVCSDGTSFDVLADGTETETFTLGSQPGEVVATDDGGCAVTCAVSQKTATCWGGEACNGATITADVYTLVGDKLHEVASGSVELDDGTLCQFGAPASILVRIP
jgi:hypothetical protein